jgi:hypothetical protein
MAYTTPPTFASGDVLDASDLNILGDDIVALKSITDGVNLSGCAVQRNASTSIANATWTAISFSTELADFGGWYTSGTNVVVPAGAFPGAFTTIACQFALQGEWASNATGLRAMRVLVNGSAVTQFKGPSLSGDTTTIDGADFLLGLAAADIITLEVYQSSGGTLNISNTNLKVFRYAPQA